MFYSEAVLLGNSSKTERLTREAPTKNVMLRNVRNSYRVNISVRFMSKVCFVGGLRILVPIRRENAFASCFLKSNSKTANAAKKIDETELGRLSLHFSIPLLSSETVVSSALAIRNALR